MGEGSLEKSSDVASIVVEPLSSDKNYPRQDVLEVDDDYLERYPNWWSRYRMIMREAFAEFLGTAVLLIFGNGVNCQLFLSFNEPAVSPVPRGSWTGLNFGWAVGVALGVQVCGGISGGHINPAVTLAFAVYRGFPWKKVPIYWLAQTLGALCGSALVYANFIHAVDIVEGGRHIRTLGTAQLFATYSLPYLTNVSAFFSEFLASALLMCIVFAIFDTNNLASPPGMAPLSLFFVLLGIGASLGMQTGYAMNPARDLGARLMTAMVGYGRQVFLFRNQYWIWCPIMAPFLGCLAGAGLYDLLIYTGKDSIVNKPSRSVRNRHAKAAKQRRDVA